MKAMVSQPTNVAHKKYDAVRKDAKAWLEEGGYEVVDAFDGKSPVIHLPISHLADRLYAMSKSNVAYFCKGWESDTICQLERSVAETYNVMIIDEA